MSKRKRTLTIILITVIVILAGCTGFVTYKYFGALHSNPTYQVQALVMRVGAVVELPAHEQPTVVTIVDRAKLSNAILRADAKNGDKLLIYSKAGRIIVYRPSSGKVIDILTIQSTANTTAGTE